MRSKLRLNAIRPGISSLPTQVCFESFGVSCGNLLNRLRERPQHILGAGRRGERPAPPPEAAARVEQPGGIDVNAAGGTGHSIHHLAHFRIGVSGVGGVFVSQGPRPPSTRI